MVIQLINVSLVAALEVYSVPAYNSFKHGIIGFQR